MIKKRLKVLAVRDFNSNKYSHGIVCVVSGSAQYPGAGVLTVGGARRGGSGYIQYADLGELPTALVLGAYPDVLIRKIKDIEADAWVVGSGNPNLPLRFKFPQSQYLILDAGAISFVNKSRSTFTIITPHEGEFAKLGYTVVKSGDRDILAAQAARELNVCVVLKGPSTVVTTPDGLILTVDSGGPELATAGTGDILAGFIASMLASWKPQTTKEVMNVLGKAVSAHGLAGKRAAKRVRPLTAPDLLNEIPRVIR